MYVFNEELLDITFSEIGTTFSNRDHSTVMKACKRVETKIKKDPDYKLAVDKQTKVRHNVVTNINNMCTLIFI